MPKEQPEVERLFSKVIDRANHLAPNSNFVIGGFEGVKLHNLTRAIIEVLLDHLEKNHETP